MSYGTQVKGVYLISSWIADASIDASDSQLLQNAKIIVFYRDHMSKKPPFSRDVSCPSPNPHGSYNDVIILRLAQFVGPYLYSINGVVLKYVSRSLG